MLRVKMKKESGITLIALVVTIIILIILATISINAVLGENGLVKKAEKVKEVTDREEYRQELQLIGLGLKVERAKLEAEYNRKWTTEEYMGRYEGEIIKDEMFIGANISNNGAEILVGTKEGYIYIVTENKVEFVEGTVEIKPTYICAGIKDGVLKYFVSPSSAEKNGYGDVVKNVTDFKYFVSDDKKIFNMPWTEAELNTVTKVEIVDEIAPKSTAFYFAELTNLKEIVGLDKLKTGNVTSMNRMFHNCYNLTSINDLNQLNTSLVTDFSFMFSGCMNIKELNIDGFITYRATNMEYMFDRCYEIETLTLPNQLNTFQVLSMSGMFAHMFKCNKIINIEKLDTSNVKTMNEMFLECKVLKDIDVSHFNTQNVENMEAMFAKMDNAGTLDLSNFNTNKVKNFYRMFLLSKFNELNLSNEFIINNDTNVGEMFDNINSEVNIIANEKMKIWLNEYYPEITNVTLVK